MVENTVFVGAIQSIDSFAKLEDTLQWILITVARMNEGNNEPSGD